MTAAGGGEEAVGHARAFALNLGIAFQIKDDLLEMNDSENSDAANNKSTYITEFGKEKAEELAKLYTEKAVGELAFFGEKGKDIGVIASELLNRTK